MASDFQEHQGRVTEALNGLFLDPCIEPRDDDDEHICLVPGANRRYLRFVSGPLVAQDRIYAEFPAKQAKLTRTVLDSLVADGHVALDLFPPSDELHELWTLAIEYVRKGDDGKYRTMQPFSPMAAAKVLAGSPNAAILLDQIRHWTPPQIFRKGHAWIAKPSAQWRAETGMSEKEYRVAREHLLKRKLVETAQMPFGRQGTKTGGNIAFIRPLLYMARGSEAK